MSMALEVDTATMGPEGAAAEGRFAAGVTPRETADLMEVGSSGSLSPSLRVD